MTELARLKRPFIEFICRLFKRGTSAFLIIFGRRETGKTDLALLIAEILYNEGLFKHFATNIKIYSSPFPIKHITNLEDLNRWATDTLGKKLFIFDEYGKAMRRRSPMASLNLKLIDQLQILRKYKLSTLAITVNEKYVDNAALGSDVLDGVFEKPDYKNQKLALYIDYLEYYTQTLTGIPGTSIEFDTWDVAPFKEHAPTRKPKFKKKEMNILWDLTHGKTANELGLHSQQIARLWRKYVKESLEREPHTSHKGE